MLRQLGYFTVEQLSVHLLRFWTVKTINSTQLMEHDETTWFHNAAQSCLSCYWTVKTIIINSTQLVKRVETVWIYTVAQNDRQFVTLLVCQNYKHCIIHEGVGAFWLITLLKKRISLMRHSSQQSNQSSVHNQ